MSEYYDRQGNPMTMEQLARRFENNEKRVAEMTLPNGRWVSTVWLGINHSFGSGPPLIFETMVFSSKGDMQELDCDRYSTEEQAISGHRVMCKKWLIDEPETEDAVDPHAGGTPA